LRPVLAQLFDFFRLISLKSAFFSRKYSSIETRFAACSIGLPPPVRYAATAVIPLQFWEKVIPKADRLPLPLIILFISNQAIQGFMRLAECGTPLGHVIRMATGNRCARSQAAV
jgi:hypothetical protein